MSLSTGPTEPFTNSTCKHCTHWLCKRVPLISYTNSQDHIVACYMYVYVQIHTNTTLRPSLWLKSFIHTHTRRVSVLISEVELFLGASLQLEDRAVHTPVSHPPCPPLCLRHPGLKTHQGDLKLNGCTSKQKVSEVWADLSIRLSQTKCFRMENLSERQIKKGGGKRNKSKFWVAMKLILYFK